MRVAVRRDRRGLTVRPPVVRDGAISVYNSPRKDGRTDVLQKAKDRPQSPKGRSLDWKLRAGNGSIENALWSYEQLKSMAK